MQHTIFVIALAAALAFGVFAVAVQRGAMLVRIDRLTALMSVIWGAISLGMACAGYGIGKWILNLDLARPNHFWVHVICGVFLVITGVRMLYRAFRKKTFIERRMEKIDVRHDTLLCLSLAVSCVLLGAVCGLLEAGFVKVMFAFFLFSTGFAVFGYMNGRSNGPVWSDRAYMIGGAILFVVGIMLQIP